MYGFLNWVNEIVLMVYATVSDLQVNLVDKSINDC